MMRDFEHARGRDVAGASGRLGRAQSDAPKPNEEHIHRAVIAMLERAARPGVWWCHLANGGKRPRGEAGRLKAMGVRAGAPDLVVIVGGRTIWLELKREGGRLSPAQRETHAALARAGAVVRIAHGLDEAIDVLRSEGVLRI